MTAPPPLVCRVRVIIPRFLTHYPSCDALTRDMGKDQILMDEPRLMAGPQKGKPVTKGAGPQPGKPIKTSEQKPGRKTR